MTQEAPGAGIHTGSVYDSDGKNRSVLVTGSAGFIGSHLCERLLADGWMVHGLDSYSNHYDRAIKRLRTLLTERSLNPRRFRAASLAEMLARRRRAPAERAVRRKEERGQGVSGASDGAFGVDEGAVDVEEIGGVGAKSTPSCRWHSR